MAKYIRLHKRNCGRKKIVSDTEVLQVIRANPNITTIELSDKLGHVYTTTMLRLKALQKQGLIEIDKTTRPATIKVLEGAVDNEI